MMDMRESLREYLEYLKFKEYINMPNNFVLPKALNSSSGLKKVLKATANKHNSSKLNLRGGKKPSSKTGLTNRTK